MKPFPASGRWTARARVCWALAVLASLSFVVSAVAQDYPNRPIRVIAPYAAGGASDVMARYFAQKLGDKLGHAVVIENQPAAAGIVAYTSASHAPPDGYTLLYATSSLTVNAALRSKPPYDPVRDFSPIVPIVVIQNVLVVPAALPVRSVAELVALAKERPGELNYVSLGPGSTPHLSMELFRAAVGINVQQVSYKLTPQAYTDLIQGRMHLWIASLPSALPFIQSGKLRALAVAGPKRSPALPDTPTLRELGIAAEASFWQGLLAPAGTPARIVARINKAALEIVAEPEVRAWYAKLGAEIASGSPEQLGAEIRNEYEKWARVVREIGLQAKD